MFCPCTFLFQLSTPTLRCMQANGFRCMQGCRLMELNASQKYSKRFEKIQKDLLNHTVMFRPCAFLFQLQGMHTDRKILALQCVLVTYEPSRTFWNFLVPSGTFWKIMEHSGTFWNILEFSGVFWNHLGPSGTFWNLLKPSGSLEFQIDHTRTHRQTDRHKDLLSCVFAAKNIALLSQS